MTICKNYYNRDENGGLDFTVHATISALTSKEMEVLGLLNESPECVRIECDLDSGTWAVLGPIYADNRPVLLMAASSLVSRGLLEERISIAETFQGEYYAARHWLDLTEKGVQVLAEMYNLGRFHREEQAYQVKANKMSQNPIASVASLFNRKVKKMEEMIKCPLLSEKAIDQMREEINMCNETLNHILAALDTVSNQEKGTHASTRRLYGSRLGRKGARETSKLAARVHKEFTTEFGTY